MFAKEKSSSPTGLVWDTNMAVACSRRAEDSREQCKVQKTRKSRGRTEEGGTDRAGSVSPPLVFIFSRPSSLSERLEKANMAAVSLFWHTNMGDETSHENTR